MPTLIALAFVVSGATSLVLQVVWVRNLIHVFGSSSLAITTVLATFMAGLALGSLLGGRWADRLGSAKIPRFFKQPILYYAAAEAIIAICALAIPGLVEAYRGTNAWLWSNLSDSPTLLALTRFLLAGTVLMIPTTAMGATLPLLTRQLTRGDSDFLRLGERVGTLYAANTGGAVLGAAMAGFVLIPSFGASRTNTGAALSAGALALGIVAVLFARRKRLVQSEDEQKKPPLPDTGPAPPSATSSGQAQNLRRWVLVAYAMSGGLAMVLEVLWSRALALVIGSSVYSFTLVLVVFLVGIALGAALLAKTASKTKEPVALLAAILAFTGLMIALSHLVIDGLPRTFLSLADGTTLSAGTLMSIHTVLTGIAILPSALGLGAVMPLAMRAYVSTLDTVGKEVGTAYAANTLGAISGSIIGGFLILPYLGLETGIRLSGLAYGASAGMLLLFYRSRHWRAIAGLSVLAALGSLLSPSWNKSDFTAGLFRTHLAEHYLKAGGLFQRDVVFYRDGIATTVSVERRGDRWILKNNGKTEASNRDDMPTQILVGLLPTLVHGEGELDVFVVGYGSGVTVGAVAQSPTVKRIDVVEIEPEVYAAADQYFSEFNNQVEKDPKVHRYVGDGRNVLLAGKRSYDIIVSEPSNPWIAGVASLFTREFYAFASDHLSDDGVFCQWAQLYELGPRNVKTIYATFAEAFPYVYAFTPGDYTSDTILLGSKRPIEMNFDALKTLFRDPVLRAELDRAEVAGPEDILASIFLGPDELGSFVAGAAINTDDNALLEYSAPKDLLNRRQSYGVAAAVHSFTWPYGHLQSIISGTDGHRSIMARSLIRYGRRREARLWIDDAEREGEPTEDVEALHRATDIKRPDPELVLGGPPLSPATTESFLDQATAPSSIEQVNGAHEALAQGDWPAAYKILHALPALNLKDPGGQDLRLMHSFAAFKSFELERAIELLEELSRQPQVPERRPVVGYLLGRATYAQGFFRKGVDLLEAFRSRYPDLQDRL